MEYPRKNSLIDFFAFEEDSCEMADQQSNAPATSENTEKEPGIHRLPSKSQEVVAFYYVAELKPSTWKLDFPPWPRLPYLNRDSCRAQKDNEEVKDLSEAESVGDKEKAYFTLSGNSSDCSERVDFTDDMFDDMEQETASQY